MGTVQSYQKNIRACPKNLCKLYEFLIYRTFQQNIRCSINLQFGGKYLFVSLSDSPNEPDDWVVGGGDFLDSNAIKIFVNNVQ